MNVLTEWLNDMFQEVDPKSFYRVIFPKGELEQAGQYVRGKYNGIIVAVTGRKKANGKAEVKRYTLTDDLDVLDTVTASDDFCLCSPLSYIGKSRTADHARNLYAIAVDVDHLKVDRGGSRALGLINLWERHIGDLKRVPRPTFIVSSGSGLHLYYVLDHPVPLFRDTVIDLQEYKRELTRIIWHDTIVDIKNASEVQYEGIYQGFRMPGTITKKGERAVAFRTGDRVSIDYLNQFVGDVYKVRHFTYKSNVRLSEAAEKYPDWYEKRIVRGEKKRGSWAVSRNLYDWWLRQIRTGATVGHRYYCMMTLAIYARKCSLYDEKKNPEPVTRDELESDCYGLVELFDEMTISDDNHFDNGDVLDALEAYDDRWITFPRKSIEYRSGIRIEQNRRNGRDQRTHLKLARFAQTLSDPDGEWRKKGGRKSKQEEVTEWRLHHPEGSKADCVRDTGLSRSTVHRHWEPSSGDQFLPYSPERHKLLSEDDYDAIRREYDANQRVIDQYYKDNDLKPSENV